MRLIDGDALKALIIRRRKEAKTLTGIDMVMVIDDAPTVDAVLVTRCKDCKWHDAEYHCKLNGYGCGRSPDWFCADGKKEEE